MKLLFSTLVTVKKKVKQIFQIKKDFITCSKMITNGLAHFPTRSDNVYFANNEQTSHMSNMI